jgi:hypothetical protein
VVADLEQLRRVVDPAPAHVGDVEEAVDAAEVDERTVLGEVLDDALDDLAFLQALERRLLEGGALLLEEHAARQHDVAALLVELDDLELEGLARGRRRGCGPGGDRPASPAGRPSRRRGW